MTITMGALYLTEQYLDDACTAAESLHDHHPELPARLVSPETPPPSATQYFNTVTTPDRIREPFDMNKIHHLKQHYYDRTLHLDTDTYICGDISPLFDLLDQFDLIVAHAPGRHFNRAPDVPDAFPEMDIGVLGIRWSEAVLNFLDNWERIWRERLDTDNLRVDRNDLFAFRTALYRSDLRFYILPPEYDARMRGPVYVRDKVKIVHGPREHDLAELADIINDEIEPRVWTGINNQAIKLSP